MPFIGCVIRLARLKRLPLVMSPVKFSHPAITSFFPTAERNPGSTSSLKPSQPLTGYLCFNFDEGQMAQFKIVALAIKAVVKPFAKNIKTRAVEPGRLRSLCTKLGFLARLARLARLACLAYKGFASFFVFFATFFV